MAMIPIRFPFRTLLSKSIIIDKYTTASCHHFTNPILIHDSYSKYFRNNGRTRTFSSSGEAFAVTSRKINSALRVLSLTQGFNPKDLRDAYFDAAKKCHSDSHSTFQNLGGVGTNSDESKKAKLSSMFLEVTEAYELLRKFPGGYTNVNSKSSSFHVDQQDVERDFISKTEEQHYREAVRESLGIDAEALEESKRCPMFREWLKGKSHMAYHFNLFLMRHGGLAPMLGNKAVAQLTDGPSRRRKRR